MPPTPLVPSADEPGLRDTHDATADDSRDILDEDGLLEDQPYAVLEENPESYGEQDGPTPEGAGSW